MNLSNELLLRDSSPCIVFLLVEWPLHDGCSLPQMLGPGTSQLPSLCSVNIEITWNRNIEVLPSELP